MIAQGDGEDGDEGHDGRHEKQVHEGKLLGVAEACEVSDFVVCLLGLQWKCQSVWSITLVK
jgi:hypothetical protein